MFKVIFFDAAETLIHLPRPVGEHYRDVARSFGADLDAEQLDQAFQRAWKEAPARAATHGPRPDDDKGWWHSLVNRVLDLTLPAAQAEAFPRDEYFETLYDHFAGPGVWEIYPEAREVLAELRSRGFALGVISNFDRRLHRVFEHLELTPFFQRIIVSSEVGADKPDPVIFQYALETLGVTAREALHVGDDPKRDWGAATLGIAVFELERPRNSLRDLLAFVEEESLRAGAFSSI